MRPGLPSFITKPMRLLVDPRALLIDPRTLASHLWHAAASGAEEVAERLAALVAAVPDRHLQQLMRTPARRVVVETIFLIMPRYLDRTRAAGLDMTIRWMVMVPDSDGDADIYDVIIEQRRCRVTRGESEARPLVTITVEPTELLLLAVGRSNPMQAYFSGRLSLRGDMMQAARLTSLFRMPTGAAA